MKKTILAKPAWIKILKTINRTDKRKMEIVRETGFTYPYVSLVIDELVRLRAVQKKKVGFVKTYKLNKGYRDKII